MTKKKNIIIIVSATVLASLVFSDTYYSFYNY